VKDREAAAAKLTEENNQLKALQGKLTEDLEFAQNEIKAAEEAKSSAGNSLNDV
jgi:hypothetical protein